MEAYAVVLLVKSLLHQQVWLGGDGIVDTLRAGVSVPTVP